MLNLDKEGLVNEADMNLTGSLPSSWKLMYILWYRCLPQSEEDFQAFGTRNHEENWEANNQDGSMPDDTLVATLFENMNDGH